MNCSATATGPETHTLNQSTLINELSMTHIVRVKKRFPDREMRLNKTQ